MQRKFTLSAQRPLVHFAANGRNEPKLPKTCHTFFAFLNRNCEFTVDDFIRFEQVEVADITCRRLSMNC